MKKIFKYFLITGIAILLLIISFFLINRKMRDDIINGKNVLEISLNKLNKDGMISENYYVSKNKKMVVVKLVKRFDNVEDTNSEIKVYKVKDTFIQEYIDELEKYKEQYDIKIKNYEEKLNEYKKEPNISETDYLALYEDYFSYLQYEIKYGEEEILIPITATFFEETESFIDEIINNM
ncbi:MAG: hypothetical protein E7314_04970 [Clostridiales bacterium]|nr:hypothetical protein [Clostridiales bacterium]